MKTTNRLAGPLLSIEYLENTSIATNEQYYEPPCQLT